MEKTTKIALATVAAVVGTVVVYASFIIYMTWPISTYTMDKAGVFGDSFGILTSIFSGLAFAGVIWTVLSQLEELSITRDQLKNQGIENAFFQMLRLHNEMLNEIDLSNETPTGIIVTTGRDVINVFRDRLKTHFRKVNSSEPGLGEREKADKAYNDFWLQHQPELAHYFRFLFNLFRFVYESESNKKDLYAKLVRAQLSNQELALLFYNCLSPQGANFIKYAEEYVLFDNLVEKDLIIPDHIEYMSNKALGKQP